MISPFYVDIQYKYVDNNMIEILNILNDTDIIAPSVVINIAHKSNVHFLNNSFIHQTIIYTLYIHAIIHVNKKHTP